jgi:YegS/Rv2252/BmrU family lipid kinase
MPKHAVKLIINPNADLGRAWRLASDLRPIADEFGGADWTGTVFPTHATELAYQAAEEGYPLVVAVGGDGTAHEVFNGLMRAPAGRRPRMGVVPMGSGNDFAFALGMNNRPEFALREVLTGQSKRLDLGQLEDSHGRREYFGNTMGIGFDATVTIRSRNFTSLQGFPLYLAAVLQTIALNHEAAHMQISGDLESWEDDLLMLVLCNGGREGGGFAVYPGAKTDDGILDYAAIRRVSRPMMLRLLPEVMNGTHGKFPQVRMGHFHHMQIKSDRPLVIHTDGEIYAGFGVDIRQLSIEILPGALEVVVPNSTPSVG